jgi:hypothetical protein
MTEQEAAELEYNALNASSDLAAFLRDLGAGRYAAFIDGRACYGLRAVAANEDANGNLLVTMTLHFSGEDNQGEF